MMPAAVSFTAVVPVNRTMSHRVAPNATRTPISRVRRDMRNDIRLYRPTDDSRHDTAAMIASVFAANRSPQAGGELVRIGDRSQHHGEGARRVLRNWKIDIQGASHDYPVLRDVAD